MSEIDTSVAMQETSGMEQSADDAQATEFSVEELVAQLTDDNSEAETVENEGDDGQPEQEEPQGKQQQQETSDKVGRRIAAALKSQRESIFAKELGMSEAEVRELIRAHKAEQMHKEDPDISPKAARRILEAQEKAKEPAVDPRVAELSATMRDMLSKGYTPDEIRELVSDETVRADIEDGKNLWQAARAFERRRGEANAAPKKRAPRTARTTAAGDSPEIDLIKSIPDDKYDEFMAELRARAMRGEKVRI